jgi:hypothetical protein
MKGVSPSFIANDHTKTLAKTSYRKGHTGHSSSGRHDIAV